MTRHECEERLLSLAQQMHDAYLEYNPAGEHMSVTIGGNGFICIRDTFFTGDDHQVVRNVHGKVFETVNVAKFSDGHIRFGEEYACV